MALIQVHKPLTIDQITEKFGVDFPSPEWVSSTLARGEEYECNRYDITKEDEFGQEWSVFLYMDEDSSEVYAIDETALNVTFNDNTPIISSPFAALFHELHHTKAYRIGERFDLKRPFDISDDRINDGKLHTYPIGKWLTIQRVSAHGLYEIVFDEDLNRTPQNPRKHIFTERELKDLLKPVASAD